MTLPKWNVIATLDPGRGAQPLVAAVAEVDAEGRVQDVNEAGTQRWGLQRGEALPETLHALLHAATPTAPLRWSDPALLAVRRPAGDGWLLLGEGPATAANPSGASDFRSLVENAPVPMLQLHADGRVCYANPALLELLGAAAEAVVGHPYLMEAVHPEDRWKLGDALRTARTAGTATATLRAGAGGTRLLEVHLRHAGDAPFCGVVLDRTAQNDAETALLQSEAFYHTFLEQSPLGIVHLDADGTITFENHPFRQAVGEAVDDAWIGRRIDEIPALPPPLLPLIRRMLELGHAFHSARVLFHPSPVGTRHLVVHGSPIRHPDGGIVGGVLMVEDVTQQHERDEELALRSRYARAEAGLREIALTDSDEDAFLHRAARLLARTAGADTLHLLFRAPLGHRYASRAGWTADDRAPAPLALSPVDEPTVAAAIAHRNRVHAGAGHPLLARTGAAEAVWAPFRSSGESDGFVVFERQRPQPWADAELRLMDQLVRVFETLWSWICVGQQHRLTVAAIDDVLFRFALGAERRYLFLTPQVEGLTGYRPADLVAPDETAAWRDALVHPDDRAAVEAHEARLRAGTESRCLYRIHHRDGSVRWLREQGTPRRDGAGHLTVSGILTDLTEQKTAEETLRQAKQEAERSNRLKTAFIATLSHELRTPLGTVKGFADLLTQELRELTDADGALPPELAEFAGIIQDRSQKLLGLVDDLFELIHLEAGGGQVRATPLCVNHLVRRSAARLEAEAREKRLALELDLCPDDPAALGDPRRLEQVFANLLSNAVKFTHEGTITVRSHRTGGEVVVEVADTGVGIAPDYARQLFTPFTQEEDWRVRRFEGTGTGLALVKHLVDRMGGRIDVESQKDRGSTFRVVLPAADAAADDVPAARRPATRSAAAG